MQPNSPWRCSFVLKIDLCDVTVWPETAKFLNLREESHLVISLAARIKPTICAGDLCLFLFPAAGWQFTCVQAAEQDERLTESKCLVMTGVLWDCTSSTSPRCTFWSRVIILDIRLDSHSPARHLQSVWYLQMTWSNQSCNLHPPFSTESSSQLFACEVGLTGYCGPTGSFWMQFWFILAVPTILASDCLQI